MLGAFHQRTVDGGAVALRDLTEAHEIGAKARRRRGGTPSATSRASPAGSPTAPRGDRRTAGGYVLGVAKAQLDSLPEKYVLTLADGSPIRWFRFDAGAERGVAGQLRRPAGAGARRHDRRLPEALAAWSSDPGTNIRLRLCRHHPGRPTAWSASDGINAIIFDDPFRNDPAHAVDGTFVAGSAA